MQTKPTNWDAILASEHIVDSKVIVDGVTYNTDKIVSLKTSGALYDEFGIGNCCSRMLEVEFYPTATPARQAQVQVSVALKTTEYVWGKYGIDVDWNISEDISLFFPPFTEYLYGYESYTIENSEVVGTGEVGTLEYSRSNPATKQRLEEFFESYPYWSISNNGKVKYYKGTNIEASDRDVFFKTMKHSSNLIKGNYIEDVTSFNENQYPNDAIQNGYWYSKTSPLPYTTSYIQKGTFFISKRETDHSTGTLKLTCYDAMLKAEQPFTEVFDDYTDFPMNPTTCVSAIATAMGITVDSRTSINNSFLVEYPVDEDGDMTLREMLGRIAVANAGNWIVTDENKLLLVGLNSIPAATNYMIDSVGYSITFGGDHIIV